MQLILVDKEQEAEQAIRLEDVVEVEIFDVRSYGFLVTTANGYRGIVHISEIAEEYIEFPGDYARAGDKHLAKVILIDEKGLSFSFKALGGLKPVYRIVEGGRPQAKAEKASDYEAVKKVYGLVAQALGQELSVRAEHELLRLIRDYGIVDVTLCLQDTLRNLDEGVLLGKLLEQKLSGNYVEYITSSHAIDAYLDRVNPELSRIEAERAILEKCSNGQILFDNGIIRLLQFGELAFPCVSDLHGWIIKTTLYYRMIANKTIDQLTREYY